MKKTITLIALMALFFTSQAQRNIDWSLDEIVAPSELNSGADNRTPFPVLFSCKNNGVDTITVGDTILYNALIIDIETSNLIVEAPSGAVNGAAYIFISPKMVVPNDTVLVGRTDITINIGVAESRDIRVGGSCVVLHRGGADEITDDSTANNTNFSDIVWYNQQGWGVGIDDLVYNNNIAVFPNPTSDQINVKLLLTSNLGVKIELIDMNGKVVISNESVNTFNNVYSMSSSELDNGIYIVKVSNGDKVHTSKVTVAH